MRERDRQRKRYDSERREGVEGERVSKGKEEGGEGDGDGVGRSGRGSKRKET